MRMLLYDVADAFEKARVPYVIVGGYALALHGIVRATIDVDLILNLKLADYEKAEACLKQIGLTSRIPVRAKDIISMREEYIRERNLIAWSFVDHANPSRIVDILITKGIGEVEVTRISTGGRRLPVASLRSLQKMKKESGRPKDLLDLESIQAKLDEKN